MLLEAQGVEIGYGAVTVVKGAQFTLAPGEIGCLLGPSGCGKTTLLRAVAGFEPLRAGRLRIAGEEVSRPGTTLAPERRGVGMVFQEFALFPHLSVADNVGFGLRRRAAAERRRRVTDLLEVVGLPHCADAFPHQLSGGQQQRVALARALAPCPRLLLLDEPFSSLDVALREGLAREVRAILKKEGMTALLVTHDQQEAFATADSIGVMQAGCIEQWGDGPQLYHRPASRFVADFIGQGVLLPGTVLAEEAVETAAGVVNGPLPASYPPGTRVALLVRPDEVIADPQGGVSAQVEACAFRGADYLYTFRLAEGSKLLCTTSSYHHHPLGSTLKLRLNIRHLVVFPQD